MSAKSNKDLQDDQEFDRMLTPMEEFALIPKNTLVEGMCETFFREIKGMCYKFSYVLVPRNSSDGTGNLRNWDLWGPFFMCLLFGLFINNAQQLIILFFTMLIGSIVVTFNTRLLGGKISFFQSAAILGYCIFPLFLVVLILQLLKFFQIKNTVVRVILVTVGCLWSIIAARAFISENVPDNRKFVSMFPICLFYLFVAMLMIFI